jgi:hypothetical protein
LLMRGRAYLCSNCPLDCKTMFSIRNIEDRVLQVDQKIMNNLMMISLQCHIQNYYRVQS